MAPAPTLPVWRYLGALLAALAVAYGVIGWQGWTPKLGLDLQGGTQVILTPRLTSGNSGPITAGQLATSVEIIRQRVDAFGVGEASVTTQGSNIVIEVPGRSGNLVESLGKTAQLRFREVLQAQPTGLPPQNTAPSGAASASPGATPASPPASGATSATPEPGPASAVVEPAPSATLGSPGAAPTAASPQGRALSSALLAGATGSAPAPTAAAPTAAAPTPAASGVPPSAGASGTPAPSGPATAPATTPAPTAASSDSAATGQVRTGDAGTPANFAALDCADPANRGGISSDDKPDQQIVACSQDGQEKYLLDVAKVVGTDVSTARAVLSQTSQAGPAQWQVLVDFTGPGQTKFTNLTEQTVGKRVAIALDGVVVSAPTIQNRIDGQAQITGSFTKESANNLANVLKFGALPLTFDRSQAEEVSPSLASDQLNAGFIAGGIGLALVVIYSLLYYRGLGVVTIGSLIAAGAVTYAAVVLLGEQLGFRLSLAGIAGLIVSIGITADSFVVYFERVKDEVREGRSLRSAVDRGWVRARRTIISADFVQFLAAIIIYFLSVGAVRGFAFTLGLVTLIDIVVVFLFTRPLVSLFARSRTFSRPGITGLGRDRLVTAKGA